MRATHAGSAGGASAAATAAAGASGTAAAFGGVASGAGAFGAVASGTSAFGVVASGAKAFGAAATVGDFITAGSPRFCGSVPLLGARTSCGRPGGAGGRLALA